MIRQWTFNKDNVHKYFLSPYVFWENIDNVIIIGRKERNDRFVWEYNTEKSTAMFKRLENGMNSDELKKAISNTTGESDALDWLSFFLQEGIIE